MNTITATHVAVIAHRLAQIGVHMDGSEPADQAPAIAINQPDMYDDGVAYWFGPDGVVACDSGLVATVAWVVDRGTFHARRGLLPDDYGVSVMPFDPGYADTSNRVHGKNAHAYDLWRLAQDTVLAPTDDEVLTAIALRRATLRRKAA